MKKILIILSMVLLISALVSCAGQRDEAALTEAQTDEAEAAVAMARIMPEAEPGIIPYDIGIPVYDPTSVQDVALIDRDGAIELALSYAELSADDVYDVEAELDEEPAGKFWDVEFRYNGYEYSYFIDAESGEIVRSDVELDN